MAKYISQLESFTVELHTQRDWNYKWQKGRKLWLTDFPQRTPETMDLSFECSLWSITQLFRKIVLVLFENPWHFW